MTALQRVYCDSLSLPALIPDNNPAGINNSITVPDSAAIMDLNVRLTISHPFVGDLRVTLTHVQTGTTVVLIDRPITTTGNCGGADIDCTLDDAATRAAENECRPTAPAIDGSMQPASPLSVFDGQNIAGTWGLNVSDNALEHAGSLFGWCLDLNSTAPVITTFTCKGAESCTLSLGESFGLSFSFTDPDGNVNGWRITGQRDDGYTFDVGQGAISPPSGANTIPLPFPAFTCPQGNCRATEFDYFLIVSDATGLDSPSARAHLVIEGSF